MMLVDANVLMYAVGAEHPNKSPAVAFLESVANRQLEATIDAEVLQEIIHRYRALRRWSDGQRVFVLARKLFPDVLSITGAVMDQAKRLADEYDEISARDAIHAAVVDVYRLEGICTFDRDFDRIRGCRRIGFDAR
jgi:predicted nucleic acid-binding protein